MLATIGRAPVVKRTPGLTQLKFDSRSAGALALLLNGTVTAANFALLLDTVKVAPFRPFAVA